MQYLCYLSFQSWKKKTSKYIYVLLGTLLSTAFLAGLLGLAFSLYNMYFEDACQNYGSYDIVISNGSQEEYEALRANEKVTKIGYVGKKTGYHIGEYQLDLKLCDTRAMEMEAIRLLEGELPQNKREIAISRQIKIKGNYIDEGYSIGDSLTISHKNGTKETYQISGILDDFDAGKTTEDSEYGAYLFQNQFPKKKSCKLYAQIEHGNLYNNIVEIARELNFTEQDISVIGKVGADEAKICINGELIPYYSWTTLNEKGGFGNFLFIMLFVILFTSILFLVSRNLITLKQNRKELAFYKMQGFQDKQLVALLWLENMLPGVIGIILGECFGVFVQKLLVYVIMQLRVYSLDNLKTGMPWYIHAGSGALLFLILAIVELFPVFIIRKVSPVEALGDFAGSKKRSRKKERKRKILIPISVWLGIQYTIKEKVRAFVTILILSITSGILFLLLFFGKNATIQLNGTYDEDSKFQYTITSIENQKLLDNDYLTELVADADKIYGLVLDQADLIATGAGERENWLCTEYKKYVRKELRNVYFPEGTKIRISIEGFDRAYYEEYTSQDIIGEVPDYDTLVEENGCILYDDFWYKDKQEEVQCVQLVNAQTGEKIYYGASENYETQEKTEAGSYTIKARAARKYMEKSEESWNYVDVYLAVPKENMIGRFGSCYLAYVHMNTSLEKIHSLGKWLESNSEQYEFMVTDHVENVLATRDKNMITLSGLIFVAILLFVISMIVVKQTITIGILERKEDIEMLYRIGMERKDYRVMLLSEDVFYSACAVLVGSIFLIGMVRLPFIQQMEWSWNIWYSLGSTLVVFCVILGITIVSGLSKKSRGAVF